MSRKYYWGYREFHGTTSVYIHDSPTYNKKYLVIKEDWYPIIDKYLRWRFPTANHINVSVWGFKVKVQVSCGKKFETNPPDRFS